MTRPPVAPGRLRLVVTADDFGISPGVSRGIGEAMEEGIVTATAVMLNFPEVEDHLPLLPLTADGRPVELAVHLNLTTGPPVAPFQTVARLLDRHGEFLPLGRFLKRWIRRGIPVGQVEREWRAQIERGLELGLVFSALNSHRHVHMLPGLLALTHRLAGDYGIGAVRHSHVPPGPHPGAPLHLRAGLALCTLLSPRIPNGSPAILRNGRLLPLPDPSSGEGIVADRLERALRDLPPGLHEIMCHPGVPDDLLELRDSYGKGRERELAALTSDAVRAAVERTGAHLTGYRTSALDRAR